MTSNWFFAPPQAFLQALLSFVVVYAVIIGLTRLTGLRSFSKMSAPDFAMTVAVGSLFASSISAGTPPLTLSVFAFICLFAGQWLLALIRRVSKKFSTLIDNKPVLLMHGSTFLRDNMHQTKITENDIRAKLREANVLSLDQVRAVVFETTGDISVLHTANPEQQLAQELLADVVGGERL
ncbi:MAG: DUF421 domain-containing protein [Anaerolineales bacterium]|nr:DUF421 domain-containing protein [Anaerolineales bacterium]